MKKVAICQSNYIPWKGYFDMINMADVFVIYDHVQYTKNDWRNRNLIKTPAGVQWLTIAVQQQKLNQRIEDTKVSWSRWNVKHWKTIVANYTRSTYFENYKDYFEELYLGCSSDYLSQINVRFIKAICQLLKIETQIISSSELPRLDDRNANLINICQELGANAYLSGPAAMSYLDINMFQEKGISVEWMNYENYPEYHQLHPPFVHGVSIVDLIFNEGPDCTQYLKSFL